ncbi:hypothetical protein Ancab_033649 [Ancistrocladus abbreviatus]
MENQDQANKSRVIKVDSRESWDFYLTQTKNQGTPIVVHFTAAWCMPSVAMNPFFEEMASTYTDMLFLTVDVDDVKTYIKAFGNSLGGMQLRSGIVSILKLHSWVTGSEKFLDKTQTSCPGGISYDSLVKFHIDDSCIHTTVVVINVMLVVLMSRSV